MASTFGVDHYNHRSNETGFLYISKNLISNYTDFFIALSHIPIMFNFTLHVCRNVLFHMMNIDVPASVGAPPLDTQLLFSKPMCQPVLVLPHLTHNFYSPSLGEQKLCVKWGSTNTGWHIDVHHVKKNISVSRSFYI